MYLSIIKFYCLLLIVFCYCILLSNKNVSFNILANSGAWKLSVTFGLPSLSQPPTTIKLKLNLLAAHFFPNLASHFLILCFLCYFFSYSSKRNYVPCDFFIINTSTLFWATTIVLSTKVSSVLL